MRMRSPFGKKRFDVLLTPNFNAAGTRGNADVRDGDLSRNVCAVRKIKRIFDLADRKRFVCADAVRKSDPVFAQSAGHIAGNNVRAAVIDKINQRRLVVFGLAGQSRSEQTVDDERISPARHHAVNLTVKRFFCRFALVGEFRRGTKNGDFFPLFRKDTRSDKPVAAVIPAAAHKQRIVDPRFLHCAKDRLRQSMPCPLHQFLRRYSAFDRSSVRFAHLRNRIGIFHFSPHLKLISAAESARIPFPSSISNRPSASTFTAIASYSLTPSVTRTVCPKKRMYDKYSSKVEGFKNFSISVSRACSTGTFRPAACDRLIAVSTSDKSFSAFTPMPTMLHLRNLPEKPFSIRIPESFFPHANTSFAHLI